MQIFLSISVALSSKAWWSGNYYSVLIRPPHTEALVLLLPRKKEDLPKSIKYNPIILMVLDHLHTKPLIPKFIALNFQFLSGDMSRWWACVCAVKPITTVIIASDQIHNLFNSFIVPEPYLTHFACLQSNSTSCWLLSSQYLWAEARRGVCMVKKDYHLFTPKKGLKTVRPFKVIRRIFSPLMGLIMNLFAN
jgi:hypothetical protein